jgi:hypothetical protein
MAGHPLMNANHKSIQIAPSDQYKEHCPAHARIENPAKPGTLAI